MMNKDDALVVIFAALENVNDELGDEQKVDISRTTPLFGSNAVIDSLSLVSLIVDVEQGISDMVGRQVSLTDDRAISQSRSPFTNPEALADYIVMLLGEQL